MATCKNCLIDKGTDDFYASNAATCKECVKARVRENRAGNLAYYRSYDRARYRDSEDRQALARSSSKTPAAARAKKRYVERIKMENPEKIRARNAIENALRKGTIKRASACFFCAGADRLEAHHPDYHRPLDVYWLCSRCHGKLHAINGDFLKPLAVG